MFVNNHAATSLYSFHRRVPNEFMKLQAKPGGYVIGNHPLSQLLRIEQAMRTVAGARSVFAKRGRKKNRVHFSSQMVSFYEITSKAVVGAAGQNKLEFVAGSQNFQVLEIESVALSRIGAFHVDYLHDFTGNGCQKTFSAGLQQDRIARFEQSLHQRDHLTLLQHGLTTG